MHLSDHSLSQLDEAYVLGLDEGRLRNVVNLRLNNLILLVSRLPV
jgi:transposase